MFEYSCSKCNEIFKTKKMYEKHIRRNIPCNFICEICGKKYSKAGYYKHSKMCKEQASVNPQLVVSNDSNVINSSSNNNNNNVQQNNTNLNNMVMMMPFGMEHRMHLNSNEGRESVIGDIKGFVVKLVRQRKYEEAYELLFRQIHSNKELPEYHNIYMDQHSDKYVCVFEGKRFELQDRDKIGTDLYGQLKMEMKWSVYTYDMDAREKDDLMAAIQDDWRHIVPSQDITLERMLRNNKPVVEKTLTENDVWPDLNSISKWLGIPVDTVTNDGVKLKMVSY